jgi:hypothetical protein
MSDRSAPGTPGLGRRRPSVVQQRHAGQVSSSANGTSRSEPIKDQTRRRLRYSVLGRAAVHSQESPLAEGSPAPEGAPPMGLGL